MQRKAMGSQITGSGVGTAAVDARNPQAVMLPDREASGKLRLQHEGSSMMIDGSFEPRVQANMDVALERVCGKTTYGESYEVRKRVAKAIVQCASRGNTTLGALTVAG